MDKNIFNDEIDKFIDTYQGLDQMLEMMSDSPSLDEIIDEVQENMKDNNETSVMNLLLKTVSNKMTNSNNRSLLQIYFDEVGNKYNKHAVNDVEIEFCEENRDKIIEMNLKCVIKIAKRYRNLGIAFEDLISAGNEGLCVAFDKYNPKRAMVRARLLQVLDDEQLDSVSHEWVVANIKPLCKYGKVKDSFNRHFEDVSYDKNFVKRWVKSNIKDASFNSVAMMWVTAYIRNEITNNSRLIKKPVSEIKKEKELNTKDVFYDINAPVSGNDGMNVLGSILYIEDNSQTDIDIIDSYNILHNSLLKMFTGLDTRCRRIVMQRFGIGLVRPMKPDEIANREKISKARVSQILRQTLQVMKSNCEKYNIDKNRLFEIIQGSKEIF